MRERNQLKGLLIFLDTVYYVRSAHAINIHHDIIIQH